MLLRPLDSNTSLRLPSPSRCPGGRQLRQRPSALGRVLGFSVASAERPSLLTPPAPAPAQPPPRSQWLLTALTSVSRTEEQTKLLPGLVKTGQCQRGCGWRGRGLQGGSSGAGGASGARDRDLSAEKPLASDRQRLGRQAGPARPRASLEVRSRHSQRAAREETASTALLPPGRVEAAEGPGRRSGMVKAAGTRRGGGALPPLFPAARTPPPPGPAARPSGLPDCFLSCRCLSLQRTPSNASFITELGDLRPTAQRGPRERP